jgi:hypothetical protein
MVAGSAPASTVVCTRAIDLQPRCETISLAAISGVAAPSEIWEELAALIAPSS